jgi:hypothetical protein
VDSRNGSPLPPAILPAELAERVLRVRAERLRLLDPRRP